MAISERAVNSGFNDNPGTVTLSITPAGTGTILWVGVGSRSTSSVLAASCTFNGVSLTRLVSQVDNGGVFEAELWYMLNPPTTTANVVVTSTAALGFGVGALAFDGAAQSAPTITGSVDGTSTTPTVSLTTTVDGSVVVAHVSAFVSQITSAGSGQTFQYSQNGSSQAIKGSTKTIATAGSAFVFYNSFPGGGYALVAAAFAPAPPPQTLIGGAVLSGTPTVTGTIIGGALLYPLQELIGGGVETGTGTVVLSTTATVIGGGIESAKGIGVPSLLAGAVMSANPYLRTTGTGARSLSGSVATILALGLTSGTSRRGRSGQARPNPTPVGQRLRSGTATPSVRTGPAATSTRVRRGFCVAVPTWS